MVEYMNQGNLGLQIGIHHVQLITIVGRKKCEDQQIICTTGNLHIPVTNILLLVFLPQIVGQLYYKEDG